MNNNIQADGGSSTNITSNVNSQTAYNTYPSVEGYNYGQQNSQNTYSNNQYASTTGNKGGWSPYFNPQVVSFQPVASSTGHWDFTVDSDLQKEYAIKQKELVDLYHSKIEEMYRTFHYLGENDYWRGQDYNLFISGIDGYRTALRDLGESVRAYANHFDTKLVPATDDLASELYQIITRAFEYKDIPVSKGNSGENSKDNSKDNNKENNK